jgi:hypothetical protein
MKSVLEKLLKRQAYPVEIEGETLFVRALTTGESLRVATFNETDKLVFALSRCMCGQDGSDLFPTYDGESDANYIKRMAATVNEFPQPLTERLTTAIGKVSKVPSPEDLQKN